ncbi:hypothetical protein JKY72_03080 [Candidatus Gracilibacteria bacterium]|nr:hypothetical protein [Candidatus Gracilibacteria bacterium]
MYSIKDIRVPCLQAISAATTFADAPIKVAFPPKHAPNDKAHHRMEVSKPVANNSPGIPKITGTITVTNGILSKTIEANPETHKTSNDKMKRSSEKFATKVLRCSRTPVFSTPATIIKSPEKKNNVPHSTDSNEGGISMRLELINASATAPIKAIK